MTRPFVKMNGAGNDFVIVGASQEPFRPKPEQVRAIADRQSGIGCDQLISLEHSDRADIFMRIWNSDGSEVEACGNAARCVAWLSLQASRRQPVTIDSVGGLMEAFRAGDESVSIDMGIPGTHWRDIPLAEDMDTQELDLTING